MKTKFAKLPAGIILAAQVFTACVIDNGDRPKTLENEILSDPGSTSLDCTEDDNVELLILDHFEFGAALGTWYANNEICEGCQTLSEELKELMNTDANENTIERVRADLASCREICQKSQFPTIFDKPLPAGEISDGGRCGSAFAFHLTTAKLTDWGANWGTKLSPPFDGTAWEGISFWARRAPHSRGNIRIEFSDKFTDGEYEDENGNTFCNSHYTEDNVSEGCDRFGGYATVGTDWKFYKIPFDDFRQAGWGVSAPYLDRAGLRSLTVLFPAGSWDIWIDDVAFYRRQISN